MLALHYQNIRYFQYTLSTLHIYTTPQNIKYWHYSLKVLDTYATLSKYQILPIYSQHITYLHYPQNIKCWLYSLKILLTLHS